MAAGGGQVEPDRLDPAKLQAYPKILDIDIDILVPQFIDKWKVQLYVALRSRYLMEVLDEPEPTLQEFVEFFAPQGVGTEDATAYYDMVVAKRQEKKQMCASALHDLLKAESLMMDQSERMLAAVQAASRAEWV